MITSKVQIEIVYRRQRKLIFVMFLLLNHSLSTWGCIFNTVAKQRTRIFLYANVKFNRFCYFINSLELQYNKYFSHGRALYKQFTTPFPMKVTRLILDHDWSLLEHKFSGLNAQEIPFESWSPLWWKKVTTHRQTLILITLNTSLLPAKSTCTPKSEPFVYNYF